MNTWHLFQFYIRAFLFQTLQISLELRRNSLKLSKSKVETKFQKTVVGLKHPVRSEQNGLERAPSEIRGFYRW